MKTTLLGAVAVAALLVNAGPVSAQAPNPAERAQERAQRVQERQERVQERQEKAQERTQERVQDVQERTQDAKERVQERAQNAQERVQERAERERSRAAGEDKKETQRGTASDEERNRANRVQRNAQDAQPSNAPTPPARRAAEQAKEEQEKTSTTQQRISTDQQKAAEQAKEQQKTEQQKTSEQQKASEQLKTSTEQQKATTAQEKPTAPSTASETETQKSGTAPAQRSTSNPTPTNPTASGTQSGTGSTANSFDQPAGTAAQPGTAAAAPQQEQRILDTVQQRIERREVQPVTNLGVTATVGTTLPTRVELNPLPREIVTIRPAYRDYRYVVSQDEVIIVDPRTRRVVEVIERRGGRVGFVDERRFFEVIERRRDLRRWRNADVVVRVGVVLPASAPFYDVPVEIVERNPRWRGYQYVVVEDEVAIVEPRTRRVVQVIDRNGSNGDTARAPDRTEVTGTLGNLGDEDRRAINAILIRRVEPGALATIRDLRGSTLPTELELQPLPREVIQRNEDLRDYRYVLIGDDALIVDPSNRRVIDVIE